MNKDTTITERIQRILCPYRCGGLPPEAIKTKLPELKNRFCGSKLKTMQMRLVRLVGALLSLITFLAPGVLLAAKKVPPTGPNCSFENRFQKLHAIQTDGTYGYIDGIRAQLQVRQSILLSVIDCALQNVEKRQKELKSLPPEFSNSKVQSDVAHGLVDAVNFYTYKRTLVPDLGIQGTQDLAAEIAAWRAGTYAPFAARQDNFEIWAQNQSLFTRTDTRFAMIGPIILSLAVLNRDDIQSSFTGAKSAFNTAKDLNVQAKAALDQGDPQSGALVKASLASLAEVYKKFTELSDRVKKIVP